MTAEKNKKPREKEVQTSSVIIHSAFSMFQPILHPFSHLILVVPMHQARILIKDGVNIPQNNIGAIKQGMPSSSFSQLIIFSHFLPMLSSDFSDQ